MANGRNATGTGQETRTSPLGTAFVHKRTRPELVVLLLVRASGGSRSVETPIRAGAECPNGTPSTPAADLGLLLLAHVRLRDHSRRRVRQLASGSQVGVRTNVLLSPQRRREPLPSVSPGYVEIACVRAVTHAVDISAWSGELFFGVATSCSVGIKRLKSSAISAKMASTDSALRSPTSRAVSFSSTIASVALGGA